MTAPASQAPVLPAPSGRAGFPGAVRSEFTKLRSVRSTYWTLLALAVATIGIGGLISWGTESHWGQMSLADKATFDATSTSLTGLFLGQLVIVVLGALIITSEYSTGMIRTSLTAMPRRPVVYAAKASVFTAVALVIGLVTIFISFFLGQALLHSTNASVTLSQPHVLRAVIGGGLFVAACGLFAFGIGAILRHTAGSITAGIGLLFVLPIFSQFLPSSIRDHVQKFLPSAAGSDIWTTQPQAHFYGVWTEFAIFLAYTVALVIIGGVLFRKRDA
jgi:ABC-type transport system involved in multi-copper enzyme maturation permease subunit